MGDATTLDGFEVLAVDGEGLFIGDGSGTVWKVAPVEFAAREDDALAEAMQEAGVRQA